MVVETRYRDRDYRSEYTYFYARAFNDVPPSAHRLHFFRTKLDEEQVWRLPSDGRSRVKESVGYLGYVVVRPLAVGGVGRVMLSPPPEVADAIRVLVSEEVNFFGQSLEIRAVPFMQQDSQLATCAHAAVWMCHYAAFRRGRISRKTIGDMSLLADPTLGMGRPLPSRGLSPMQISALFQKIGLPAAYTAVADLPHWEVSRYQSDREPEPLDPADAEDLSRRVAAYACRYLNSSLPVLVQTTDHAIVLCGYTRHHRTDDNNAVELVYHDDQEGPYLVLPGEQLGRAVQGTELVGWLESKVDSTLAQVDEQPSMEWDALYVPLLEKLWLPAEDAERLASTILVAQARALISDRPTHPCAQLVQAYEEGHVVFRTYASESKAYKQRLPSRAGHDDVVKGYRLARWPLYVWVVEAIDRRLRPDEERNRDRAMRTPCVLGEVVLDPTQSAWRGSFISPTALATRLPGHVAVHQSVGRTWNRTSSEEPYPTGGVGPP